MENNNFENQEQEVLHIHEQLGVLVGLMNELKNGLRRSRRPRSIVTIRPRISAPAPEGMAAAGDARHVANNLRAPTQRKWYALCFWTIFKLSCWTLKIYKTLVLLFFFISIGSGMLWDFRLLESQFAELAEGILSPKYIRAITEWELAINKIAFDLDPKYPIYKFVEESIWTKVSRVFGNYWN